MSEIITMPLAIVPILALVLFWLTTRFVWNRRLPLGFRNRACQGRAWRRAFPEAPKDRIRSFLDVFVESFGFDSSCRLSWSPQDRILGVYEALYPRPWGGDAMELEAFALMLEKRYGLRLAERWNDQLTLGELFGCIEERLDSGR